jgi:hypothetical protein
MLSAMAVPALAQYDWDVGIEVGDWFLYSGTLEHWEDYGNETLFPPAYLEYLQVYNESDWMRYAVTSITPGTGGDIVTFSVLTHWTNGTETTDTVDDNMTSSQSMMVIGANLTDYTEVRPAYSIFGFWPMPARVLNESIMLVTDNGTRETNVLDHPSDIFGNVFYYTYYWDKETGIQVYFQNNGTDVTDQWFTPYSYRCKMELINSSLGIVIPDLTAVVMLSTLFTMIIPIVLYRRKKRPN